MVCKTELIPAWVECGETGRFGRPGDPERRDLRLCRDSRCQPRPRVTGELAPDSGAGARHATRKECEPMGAKAEQVKGQVKEAAGSLTGDKDLESEGKADRRAGRGQREAGRREEEGGRRRRRDQWKAGRSDRQDEGGAAPEVGTGEHCVNARRNSMRKGLRG